MNILRWILYALAAYMVIAGLWIHSWLLIPAGIAVWVIYPLISDDIDEVALPACLGCQRHFVIPGCPVHDPEDRSPRAVNRDAEQTTERAEESVGY